MRLTTWCVQEGAQKQIPIMLVGNKSDLRADQMAADSSKTCVKHDDGQRLARVSHSQIQSVSHSLIQRPSQRSHSHRC